MRRSHFHPYGWAPKYVNGWQGPRGKLIQGTGKQLARLCWDHARAGRELMARNA